MSETCPASQGRGERHIVCTDESEGLTRYPGAVNPSDPAYAGPPPFTQGRLFYALMEEPPGQDGLGGVRLVEILKQ